jgi:hypothetical protein
MAREMSEKNESENGEVEVSIVAATAPEMACLESLVKQCREQGLLKRPEGLSAEDAVDGLNDGITLLYGRPTFTVTVRR